MKLVKFQPRVDESRCKGDSHCERVCSTGAIKVIEKIATVDEDRCIACNRCFDRCPDDAITMVLRPEPKLVTTSTEGIDDAEIKALCMTARRLPDELVCICTTTFAAEIAVAVIKGARSIRDIAAMTGVASGCQEFCVPVVQRMLKAYGLDITEVGAPLNYDQSFSMWDIPADVKDKYPEYYFKEDIDLATKNRGK